MSLKLYIPHRFRGAIFGHGADGGYNSTPKEETRAETHDRPSASLPLARSDRRCIARRSVRLTARNIDGMPHSFKRIYREDAFLDILPLLTTAHSPLSVPRVPQTPFFSPHRPPRARLRDQGVRLRPTPRSTSHRVPPNVCDVCAVASRRSASLSRRRRGKSSRERLTCDISNCGAAYNNCIIPRVSFHC